MNSMETIGSRIREVRQIKGLSQTELGQRIGYTKSSVSEWESGKKLISLDVLQKIARVLGQDVSFFLGESPPNVVASDVLRTLMGFLPVKPIPVLGRIHAGTPWHAEEVTESEVFVPQDVPADFALTVQGDSLVGAHVYPGDLALCQAVTPGVTPKPGDLVVALVNGDEALLKFLVHERGQWILRAANPHYPDHVLTAPEDPRIQAIVLRIDTHPHYPGTVPAPTTGLDVEGLTADQVQVVQMMIDTLRQTGGNHG